MNQIANIQEFIQGLYPFNQLSTAPLKQVMGQAQLIRYRIGQAILVRETTPADIFILYQGQVRLLGYDPSQDIPTTLKLLEPGEILGWISLVRGVGCETAIASSEVICITLPASAFLALLSQEPKFAAAFSDRCALIEVFDLLGAELQRQANSSALIKALQVTNLKELALKVAKGALVYNLSKNHYLNQLDADYIWLVSSNDLFEYPVGSRWDINNTKLKLANSKQVRLIGIKASDLSPQENTTAIEQAPLIVDDIPYAPERPKELVTKQKQQRTNLTKYPLIRAKGSLESTIACFKMLSQHFGVPFRQDVIRRVVSNSNQRNGNISLQLCGAVAEVMGLNAQLVRVPANAIARVPTPAMITWQESFAIIYQATPQELILGVPEIGIIRRKPADFIETWGQDSGEVLLLKTTKETPKQRFGISWFLPAIKQHRKVLLEVLVASFLVQLFGLANPLITQVIIDTVIVKNSIDTLHILGIFLLIVAVFEAVLTSVRNYLFVDTTNRIDLSLGSEIIDHLVRLPLRYFERRPVGELSSRINELENIRSFLTGTALTVVLDAVFSIIYIVVMLIYSWLLTLVALATLPLFILSTMVVSPVVRRQLRSKAERNAETQSYLVEILSGIQTVKAQNIELKSRWQWQEKYAKYINAGFNTALTSTTASSISNFLNKLSGLLLLWVGAYLVLDGKLTLGQLIAFRIIASYTTSPLLRLVQLWQNFQETALSLERLSDIIDAPQEADENNRYNIPMPTIEGAVKYENVSFRFASSGALQLSNVNIEIPKQAFVGIVGQSGSGKSTLMKLISRLYEPNSGRILIDDYDISKVELYSLRRQIGMVLQDTLLFNGTVQENIALTNPDASSEEIVAAAKIAAAHDFIMALPNGYNTRVGERGAALSGGQRQRIAIARTILQNPRLLILDEATSALDYDAERQVCLNLANAFEQTTVFFITHRLNSIKNADLILMMDKGAIVEQGNHQQLMAIQGRYYCLYQQQETQS